MKTDSLFLVRRLGRHGIWWLMGGLAWSAVAGDWPQWRGPERSGVSQEKDWSADFPSDGPDVLWTAKVGTGFSTVSVAGGRVFTQGNDGDQDTVFCLDAATGKAVWKYTYPHPLDAKYYKGGTSATPTVDGKWVYVLSRRGHLRCLDAGTGAVRWEVRVIEELGAKHPEWGFASSVLIDGPRAVVNVGRNGAAFDKATGKLLWKSGKDTCGYATPVPWERGGQRMYLMFAATALVAVKAETGEVVWEHPWKTSYDVNAADPVVVDAGRVFIASGYNRGGALLDVTGPKPRVIWENKNLRTQLNAAVLFEGYLYAIDGDTGKGQLRCVDVATGEVKWTYPDTKHGALTVAGGRLIVVSEKGELIVAEASPTGFKALTRGQVAGGLYWTAPVLAHGRIYIRSGDGLLSCVDVTPRKVASVR